MTEFEAAILRNDAVGNILMMGDGIASHIAIYLTLISGYLIAAFLAGNRLSKVQVSIATALYTLAYLFSSLILLAYFRAAGRAIDHYLTLNPAAGVGLIGDLGGGYLGLVLVILVYIASIWFMWNVRRAKNS
jgi:hypothetical protein